MDFEEKLVDQRLISMLHDLAHSKVAQQRLQSKIARSRNRLARAKTTTGNNSFDRSAALAKAHRGLQAVGVNNYLLTAQARAIHLYRAMMRGVPYYKLEGTKRHRTMEAADNLRNFLPFDLSTDEATWLRDWAVLPK